MGFLYEYYCPTCSNKNNKETLFYLSASEPPKENPPCPNCGNLKTIRSWNAPFIKFKGNGFYSSDSKRDGDEVDV
jgi:predicted nucleic acid-binding Zn ribbon protein